MAFLVYRRTAHGGSDVLEATGHSYSLAGRNLVWKGWIEAGRPISQGWHLSAEDLVRLSTEGKESYATQRLLIDYDPRSTQRIALIELLDIYLYTWGDAAAKQAEWTPMMLRMRDVLEEWPDAKLTPPAKERRLQRIASPSYGEPFVEFLYLKGDDHGWNWGRNGATNAVFLHGAARDYFRPYF